MNPNHPLWKTVCYDAGSSLDGWCLPEDEADELTLTWDHGTYHETQLNLFRVGNVCEDRFHSSYKSFFTLGFRPSLSTTIGAS